MKRLLVLGAGGMLGAEILSKNHFPNWETIGHGRDTNMKARADLINAAETITMLDAFQPDALINLVALTNVDHCESFPNDAYISNVKTLENIVSWLKRAKKPVHLVHISTDQIYDGIGPHREDNVSLRNYYAFSKYAAELVATSVKATVLRTNFFGKSKCSKRNSLSDWIYTELKSGRPIDVFDDVMFSPLSMGTLCNMINTVLENKIKGIYNLGSNNGMSKADFAYALANTLGLNLKLLHRCSINKATHLKSYRPKDMRLDVSLFEERLETNLPTLADEIRKSAEEYAT